MHMITKQDLDNYSGDRRSREYKDMKLQFSLQSESQGLGDTVEKVLKATGIKTIYNFIVGEDCKPCDDRRKTLNALLPYGSAKQIRWFTEEETEQYGVFFNSRKTDSWTVEQVNFLFTLYAGVFNKRYNIKRMCSSCMGTANILRGITGDLDRVYDESI